MTAREPVVHAVACGHDLQLQVTESRDDEEWTLSVNGPDGELVARADRFEDALDALCVELPSDAQPRMCGTCRHGHLDPFGGSDGRFDLSCFRDDKEASAQLARLGRAAPDQVLALLYRRRVDAFFLCTEFAPRRQPPTVAD